MLVKLSQPVRELGNDVSTGEERESGEDRREDKEWFSQSSLHVPAQHVRCDVDQITRRAGRVVKELEHLITVSISMLLGHELHEPARDLMQVGGPLPSARGAAHRAA